MDTSGSAPDDDTAYRFYRIRPTKLRSEKTKSVQLECVLFRAGGAEAIPIKSSNPGGDNPRREGPENAIEGAKSKWVDKNVKPLIFEFAAPFQIEAYTWTTANDAPGRDMVRWVLEGSTDGQCWQVLHDVDSDFDTPSDRRTTLPLFALSEQPRNTPTTQAAEAAASPTAKKEVEKTNARPRRLWKEDILAIGSTPPAAPSGALDIQSSQTAEPRSEGIQSQVTPKRMGSRTSASSLKRPPPGKQDMHDIPRPGKKRRRSKRDAMRISGRDSSKKNSSINGLYKQLTQHVDGVPAYKKVGEGAVRYLYFNAKKAQWKISDILGEEKQGFARAAVVTDGGQSGPHCVQKGSWQVFAKDLGHVLDENVSCTLVPAGQELSGTSSSNSSSSSSEAHDDAEPPKLEPPKLRSRVCGMMLARAGVRCPCHLLMLQECPGNGAKDNSK